MDFKDSFSIAEIKSVRKLADGTHRAGFKKISHNVTAVQVSRVEPLPVSEPVANYYLDDGQGNLSYSGVFSGLLVDNDADNNPKLLIPRKEFKRGNTYNFNIDGDEHLITAGKVISKQRDWILFEALL